MLEYTPTRWNNGTTPPINAENLNNIENGIVNLVAEVKSTSESVANIEVNKATKDHIHSNYVTSTRLNETVKELNTKINNLPSQMPEKSPFTWAQIKSLDSLFAQTAYTDDNALDEYESFRKAFGIVNLEVMKKLTAEDLEICALSITDEKGDKTYIANSDVRVSYTGFDIPAIPGHSYLFSFNARDDIRMDIGLYTVGALKKIAAGDSLDNFQLVDGEEAVIPADGKSLGWISDHEFFYTVPQHLVEGNNDSIPATFRFTFKYENYDKKSSANEKFTQENLSTIISGLTVERWTHVFRRISGDELTHGKLLGNYYNCVDTNNAVVISGYYGITTNLEVEKYTGKPEEPIKKGKHFTSLDYSKRISYVDFDIPATPGYTYMFTFKSPLKNIYFGPELYSKIAGEKVEKKELITVRTKNDTSEGLDLNWNDNYFMFTVPDLTYSENSNSIPWSIRFTFKWNEQEDAKKNGTGDKVFSLDALSTVLPDIITAETIPSMVIPEVVIERWNFNNNSGDTQ